MRLHKYVSASMAMEQWKAFQASDFKTSASGRLSFCIPYTMRRHCFLAKHKSALRIPNDCQASSNNLDHPPR